MIRKAGTLDCGEQQKSKQLFNEKQEVGTNEK
jgi:hypothetical protein